MQNTVKQFQEIFGSHPDMASEQEAIRIISTVQSKGSELQKTSFRILENHQAALKLFKLGLREPAVELAKTLVHNADWNQHYEIAVSLTTLLVKNAYLCQDMDEIKMYRDLRSQYKDIMELEYESQLIYGDLLFNHQRGLPIDKAVVQVSLEMLKSKLRGLSTISDYYYFQCLLMIYSDSEKKYEEICLEAIDYFESLYVYHKTLINIFQNRLLTVYMSDANFLEAEAIIERQLSDCEAGERSWYRMYWAKVRLQSHTNNVAEALRNCDMIMSHETYQGLCTQDREGWTTLKAQLTEELVRVKK